MANWTDTTPTQLLDAHLQRPANTGVLCGGERQKRRYTMKDSHDSIETPGLARKARGGVNCPVCGRWKRPGSLACNECMKEVSQQERNVMGTSLDAYIATVRDLRARRRARKLGIRLLID